MGEQEVQVVMYGVMAIIIAMSGIVIFCDLLGISATIEFAVTELVLSVALVRERRKRRG